MAYSDWAIDKDGNVTRKPVYRAELVDEKGRRYAALLEATTNKGAVTTAVRRYLGRMERNGWPQPTEPIVRTTNYEVTDVWDYATGTWHAQETAA